MSNDAEKANILERLENIRSEYDMFPDDYGALTVAIERVKSTQPDNPSARDRVLRALDEIRQYCTGRACADCAFGDGRVAYCEIRRRVSLPKDSNFRVNTPCFWETQETFEEVGETE